MNPSLGGVTQWARSGSNHVFWGVGVKCDLSQSLLPHSAPNPSQCKSNNAKPPLSRSFTESKPRSSFPHSMHPDSLGTSKRRIVGVPMSKKGRGGGRGMSYKGWRWARNGSVIASGAPIIAALSHRFNSDSNIPEFEIFSRKTGYTYLPCLCIRCRRQRGARPSRSSLANRHWAMFFAPPACSTSTEIAHTQPGLLPTHPVPTEIVFSQTWAHSEKFRASKSAHDLCTIPRSTVWFVSRRSSYAATIQSAPHSSAKLFFEFHKTASETKKKANSQYSPNNLTQRQMVCSVFSETFHHRFRNDDFFRGQRLSAIITEQEIRTKCLRTSEPWLHPHSNS